MDGSYKLALWSSTDPNPQIKWRKPIFSGCRLCCCSESCCFSEGRRQRREEMSGLLNYSYPLQTIIPGSPWRRRTTTATPTTSTPVRSWVLFVRFSAALLESVASEAPFFFLKRECFYHTLSPSFTQLFIDSGAAIFISPSFFKLRCSWWITRLLPPLSKWPPPPPSAQRELCVIFS